MADGKNILYSKTIWGLAFVLAGILAFRYGLGHWSDLLIAFGLGLAGYGRVTASKPLRIPRVSRKGKAYRDGAIVLAALGAVIAALSSGCAAKDARQLYGQVTAVSQTLHTAQVSYDDAQAAAGVPLEKRLERYEAIETVLSEYRSYETILRGYMQALEAAERIGDGHSRDAINAKARANAELAAAVARRVLALLSQQEGSKR
jgi:hypothetical protein